MSHHIHKVPTAPNHPVELEPAAFAHPEIAPAGAVTLDGARPRTAPPSPDRRQALFYLRARGLPQDEARQLLTAAFCREPLVAVQDPAVRDALLARLDATLEGLSG